jgi:hypothetical protein
VVASVVPAAVVAVIASVVPTSVVPASDVPVLSSPQPTSNPNASKEVIVTRDL